MLRLETGRPSAREEARMGDIFFYAGLSLILTHELDAVRRREWRIFPGLARLDDETGYALFTALHVPLFLALLWALFDGGLERGLADGLSAFFVVHVGLHLLALRHPRNEFTGLLSWAAIGGAGLCGVLHLLVGP
jgi:hypothetical protein